MITEDYVSFEVAKLLKEKGFDEPCQFLYFSKYKQEGDFVGNFNTRKNSEINEASYSAPTLQMAMKWLREVHNLHCNVDYDYVLGWYCQITSLTETVEDRYKEMKYYHPDKDNGFSSPEEACESAIRYSLQNLI